MALSGHEGGEVIEVAQDGDTVVEVQFTEALDAGELVAMEVVKEEVILAGISNPLPEEGSHDEESEGPAE